MCKNYNCVKTIPNDNRQAWVSYRDKYLDPNRAYKFSFIGGTEQEKQHVRDGIADFKLKVPGLDLSETESNGDIRISFDKQIGAWSYVGSDIFRISPDQPTMNLGFFGPAGTYQVVQHELAHTCGILHEHLSLKFDRLKTYEYFERFGWDKATVDNNLFSYNPETMDKSKLDEDSIMMYYLPCEIITDNIGCEKDNLVMSKGDIDRLNVLFPVSHQCCQDNTSLTLKKIFNRKSDLNKLREIDLIVMATELGLESNIRYKKSYTVDLIWNHLSKQ